jgi:hypothetical protein
MAECTAAERVLLDALESGGSVYEARWAVFLEWTRANPERIEDYERAQGLARRWARKSEEAWEALRAAGMPEAPDKHSRISAEWERFFSLRQKRSHYYTGEKDRPFASTEDAPADG